MRDYVRGLPALVARKNSWRPAEQAGPSNLRPNTVRERTCEAHQLKQLRESRASQCRRVPDPGQRDSQPLTQMVRAAREQAFCPSPPHRQRVTADRADRGAEPCPFTANSSSLRSCPESSSSRLVQAWWFSSAPGLLIPRRLWIRPSANQSVRHGRQPLTEAILLSDRDLRLGAEDTYLAARSSRTAARGRNTSWSPWSIPC